MNTSKSTFTIPKHLDSQGLKFKVNSLQYSHRQLARRERQTNTFSPLADYHSTRITPSGSRPCSEESSIGQASITHKHCLCRPVRAALRKTRPAAPFDSHIAKRRRLHFSETRIELTFIESCLICSRSHAPILLLLPRYSSSDPSATTMLSNAQDAEDPGGIKTVRMPRGTDPSVGMPHCYPASLERGSSNRSVLAISSAPKGLDTHHWTSAHQLLTQIGIAEFLEQDSRPTFIIDLSIPITQLKEALPFIYVNASLRSQPSLLDALNGKVEDETSSSSSSSSSFSAFSAWALGSTKCGDSTINSSLDFNYAGICWTAITLKRGLRVVGGNYSCASHGTQTPLDNPAFSLLTSRDNIEPSTDYFASRDNQLLDSVSPLSNSDSSSETRTSTIAQEAVLAIASPSSLPRSDREQDFDDHAEATQAPPRGFFDWTRLPLSSLPAHIRFARNTKWESTSLGPIENWSNDLREMCNVIMASPHPSAMYWGEDFISIYNEAYVLLAGQNHPALMGKSYKLAWGEIWDDVKSSFQKALQTGQATMKDDDRLFIYRNNFLEETYFSWSIIPIVGENGSVVGLYNPAFERTRRKISERRMLTLREVGEKTATAREVKEFFQQVLKALETNTYDSPFVILYSVADESESDTSSISSSLQGPKYCYLEGTLGVPEGHPAAPKHIDLKYGTEGFTSSFRDSIRADGPIVLSVADGGLEPEMIEGIQWRGFGDPCTSVVICPIHPTTGEAVLGFLVMGVNPRRPYDKDYNLYIQLLSRQLATSLASVVLFEEEIRRSQRAAEMAAIDRMLLSEKLAQRTAEAAQSEKEFTRMAELAPVGICIADSDGHITFCNDMWFEIAQHPKDASNPDRWMDSIHPDDREKVEEAWKAIVSEKQVITIEFRFKARWEGPHEHQGNTWGLASAFPEVGEDGNLLSIFASLTDISQQKYAEGFVKQRLDEAVELKRQQENFIDITSHEMRNPLGAVLQCADEITATLLQFMTENANAKAGTELIESAIDSSQTITLCAQHQKRVVDDVLTLSKLDSAMLIVTPVDIQPIAVVQKALKMSQSELLTADILMQFHVGDSYKAMGVDWVRLDPSRLLQVLINLLSNAIKFTSSQDRRTITVTVDSSLEPRQNEEDTPVKYFERRSKWQVNMNDPDWGGGEELFLHFAVRDTGRGLNEEEKKTLFMRFSQASPRTHVQYGGSGLGLFISRELVELQGGEIGVSSEAGKGSTFAFYIKAKRSDSSEIAFETLESSTTGKSGLAYSDSKICNFATNATPESSGDRLPVLIVEDNLVNQKVLQKQLRRVGFIVAVANHGSEALDKIERSRYWKGRESDGSHLGVILMDLEMPVMDGMTCAKRIRQLQQSGDIVKHIPIIAVTANARKEQIEAAIHIGIDAVVAKPFHLPEIIPKIQELSNRFLSPGH